jgi:NAD(P)-dependent dehydrogenase (short-subunit alcohol dehydrogenase family)
MATEKTRPGVVITGAAGDMGAALCDSFLSDGFRVFGADIVAPKTQERLIPFIVDVTDRTAVFDLAERAAAESRLVVWVNCAGVFRPGAVPQASTEDWHRIIAVNLTGTFHGCAAALAVMSHSGGGRIVNAGSLSGHVGGTGIHPAYGASKAGVHALTKTYALEGARHGIACNAVAPGVLEGRMGGQFADSQLDRLARSNPMRRLGRIEEAVDAIRFLADPARASYLNGVILPVNGGAYMPS